MAYWANSLRTCAFRLQDGSCHNLQLCCDWPTESHSSPTNQFLTWSRNVSDIISNLPVLNCDAASTSQPLHWGAKVAVNAGLVHYQDCRSPDALLTLSCDQQKMWTELGTMYSLYWPEPTPSKLINIERLITLPFSPPLLILVPLTPPKLPGVKTPPIDSLLSPVSSISGLDFQKSAEND